MFKWPWKNKLKTYGSGELMITGRAKPTSEITSGTTWVKGLGAHAGKPAKHLGIGEVIIRENSKRARVMGISVCTANEIVVRLQSGPLEYEWLFDADQIVAIEGYGVWRVLLDKENHR